MVASTNDFIRKNETVRGWLITALAIAVPLAVVAIFALLTFAIFGRNVATY